MGKETLVLKVLPYVVAVIIVIIVLSASIPILRGGMDVSMEGDMDVSINGSYIFADGVLIIDSGLTYDVEGVTLKVYIVDDILGSKVNILTLKGIVIESNSITKVDLKSRALIPSVFLILRDLASRDGSDIPIRVEFSGKYIHGLIGINVTLDSKIQLSEPDSKLDYKTWKDDYSLSFEVRNISSDIPVPEYNISIAGGGTSAHLTVTKDGNIVSAKASTDGQFIKSLNKITESFSAVDPTVTDNLTGNPLHMEPNDVKLLLDFLAYMWGDVQ